MPPPKYELVDRYSSLVTTITDIITGEDEGPRSLSHWFYKSLSWKLFGQTKVCTPHTYLLIRTLIDNLSHFSREDIEQQAWLYLMEMWDFYVDTYKHNKVARFVFYDYVRFNLIKYMTNWVANQVHLNMADFKAPVVSGVAYVDDPQDLNIDLGWVILKSETGFLASLSTRQKYLIFLRYVKQMSILEISKLTQRNHKSIEKDFTAIHKVINSGGLYE
jgi:hypothetical protein